ncbi:helix-turn-helix domain-containing protein [Thermoactinomyces daqus]|uniref:Helix-turn-helix domain-containing protein n=1 Tax=Thermoactinomyces daqus TaxID=1329516 RepID=A0A7W2AGW7_9BACL|nr:helix-turn-helix domain-containing protein [Thermoactinomyces daqus]MBA4542056.1 helix-turn-helix domain-containing protein [Thermoactinomyces daqus]
MISYDPLFATLEEKNKKLIELINEGVVSKPTAAKFRKGESVQLSTIDSICKYLGVPIEKVVRIDP